MSRYSTRKLLHHEIFSRHIGEIRSLLHALELRDNDHGRDNRPPVDIYESGENIVLEFDLPGFRIEDISLTVSGLTLVLEASRPREQVGRFVCLERSHGRFHHAVHIPCSFDACSISAEYRRGVLRVTCPKINDRTVPIKEILD